MFGGSRRLVGGYGLRGPPNVSILTPVEGGPMRYRWRVVWLALAASCAFSYGMAARIAHGQGDYAPSALVESVALANHVWHTPCYGVIELRVADIEDPALLAYAQWTHGRVYTDCVVVLDIAWPRWRPAFLCTVWLHETGHHAGMEHSANYLSVMYPAIWRTDPRCRRLFREGRYWQ